MSDHDCYAGLLPNLMSYTNTYLHQEPHLDVCDPSSIAKYRGLDLIICSDVIEHTKDPPKVVLGQLRQMLALGGTVILSAPTYSMQCTVEWYSGAKHLDIVVHKGGHAVIWNTIRGNQYLDVNPSFHGGGGDVLEMRINSYTDLIDNARAVGFDVALLEFVPDRGYQWPIRNEYPGLDATMDGRILILRRVV